MILNSFTNFLIDALKSIKRNKTISFAAIITVAITFFLFGTFTLTALNLNNSIKDVASKIEIKVYLLDDIKTVERRELELTLKELEGVNEVKYETKDEAFVDLQDSLEDNQGLLQGYDLDNNPLPSSFVVKVENGDYVQKIIKTVENMSGVESIGNQQDLIDTITSFVNIAQLLGLALFALFIGVSLFLIINTIKLTVYSRRREVGIMKFVGATDWFIRWPFIIEGIIIGTIGSIISVITLYFAYISIHNWISEATFMVTLIDPIFVISTILWFFLGGGILIGTIGSIMALRKFLVV